MANITRFVSGKLKLLLIRENNKPGHHDQGQAAEIPILG